MSGQAETAEFDTILGQIATACLCICHKNMIINHFNVRF